MLSIRDAVTNRMMRDIAASARDVPRQAKLSPKDRKLLEEGVVLVRDQIAFTSDALSRRAWLDSRPPGHSGMLWDDTLNEFEENEFYIWTDTPFADPSWRVEIFDQGMLIVQGLAPKLAAISPLPFQIVLSINSGFDEDPDEGSDAMSGVVKFYLMRPGSNIDGRIGIEGTTNPAAVFTLPV